MEEKVSQRQQEFIDFMKRFEKMHGYAPTFKEIAIGLEISSKGSVSAMMATLSEMGYVEKADGANRGTRIRRPVQASR